MGKRKRFANGPLYRFFPALRAIVVLAPNAENARKNMVNRPLRGTHHFPVWPPISMAHFGPNRHPWADRIFTRRQVPLGRLSTGLGSYP